MEVFRKVTFSGGIITKNEPLKICIVFGIIALFIGVSIQPCTNAINLKTKNIELIPFKEDKEISNGLAPRSNEHIFSIDVKSAPNVVPTPINEDYVMYGYNVNPWSEETFYFPINDPSDYNCLGESISKDFLAGGTFGCDEIWYGVQYGNGLLYGMDPYSGDMWTIGGGGTGMNGLAYDPITNTMYGSSDTDQLYKIDTYTGDQELIGAFDGDVKYMIGMAFDAEGTLYGWDLGSDSLWTIDTGTGEATQVGHLGISINYAQDGDFHRESDTLYLTAYTSCGLLYTCDKTTGQCTLVGNLQANGEVTASIFLNSCIPIEHDIQLKSIDSPQTGRAEPNMPMTITVKNNGNKTETFDAQMEIIKCETGPLIMEEYFDSGLPADWETDYWLLSYTDYAGGQSPEMRCYKYTQYYANDYYDNYLQTGPTDCTGLEKVNLRFRWAGDYQSPQYASVYVKFRRNSTSPWKDVTPWDNPINEQQDEQLYEIGCYSFGEPMGDEFQIRWEYIGYYYYFNYLWLDDVILEACDGCTEYAELAEDITLATGEETQVSFPGWMPNEWQNESFENTWEKYPIHAFIILDRDQNTGNDERWVLIELWYPWMHDIEVMNIDSPHKEGRGVPGQTFPVQVTMRNIGQYTECCIPIDIKIGNQIILDTFLEESSWPNEYPEVPADGWTDEHKEFSYNYGWRRIDTSYSGGTSPEAFIPYYYCKADYNFYSFTIDASDYQMFRLRFLTYIDHYSGQGLYSLEAGYSTDGKNWYAAWHEEPDSSGGYEADVPIEGGSETTYIGFWVAGNPYYFNCWYIDNVELVATVYTEEYSDFVFQDSDIDPGEEATFTFDDWTPAYLSKKTSGSEDYIVEAEIEMAGDKNPCNDIKTEGFTLDFWWDAGIDEITSPFGVGHPIGADERLWDNGNPDGRNGLAGGMYSGYSNILIDDFENGENWNI